MRAGTPSTICRCATTAATAQSAASCSAPRYDLVAVALGGHGELVERAEDMAGAIERSLASGKPACINVMIESIPSPVVRRPA